MEISPLRVRTATVPNARPWPVPSGLRTGNRNFSTVPTFMSFLPCRTRSPTLPCKTSELSTGILFRATADTLRTIAADPKHLGAQIGFFAVLHTWGQNLLHHPHLHCVVPGGGLSLDGTQWMGCRPGFFLPVRVLSRLFRRLFLKLLRQAFESGDLQFFGSLDRSSPD